MTQTQPGARLRQHVGRQAHVFLAAGNHQFGVAATDRLNSQLHGLEARAADLVQGQGRGSKGQAGLDRRLACRVLAGACGEHLAEDHFIDLRAVQTGFFQQTANHCGTQLGGWNRGQGTLKTANGGTSSGNDYDFVHA
ncbi:hypothetical protein FQZ97_1050770 [compost metagenome]